MLKKPKMDISTKINRNNKIATKKYLEYIRSLLLNYISNLNIFKLKIGTPFYEKKRLLNNEIYNIFELPYFNGNIDNTIKDNIYIYIFLILNLIFLHEESIIGNKLKILLLQFNQEVVRNDSNKNTEIIYETQYFDDTILNTTISNNPSNNDEIIEIINKLYITRIFDYNIPHHLEGGKNDIYKKTENKIIVIYNKKRYRRIIYTNKNKKYVKINKTFMLLSKLVIERI